MNELVMISAYVENRIKFYKADQGEQTFNNRIIEELSAISAMADSVLIVENEREEIAKVLTRIAMLGKPLTEEEFIESLNKDQPMSDNKKYYYLRLKDNFFDSDELKILEV